MRAGQLGAALRRLLQFRQPGHPAAVCCRSMLLPLEIAAVTSTVAVLTVVALALDAQNRRNQWRHRSTSQLVSLVQLASVVQTVPEDDTALALTSVGVPLAARDAQTLRGLVWWLTRLNSAHGPLSLYTSARNERTVRMGC